MTRPVGKEPFTNYLGDPIPRRFIGKDFQGNYIDVRDKPLIPTFVDYGGQVGKEWE
jgi:hypothetical protein